MEWWQTVASAQAIGSVPDVDDLTHDSRRARPGTAFAAVPGGRVDGHDFIAAAVESGAGAVVVQADCEPKWRDFAGSVPLVVVEDTRAAIGPLAAAVHGEPSKRLRIVGITGTDGKTTTSHLAAHVLQSCGLYAGYLTSAGFDTGSGYELNASHMTTVEATTLQSLLAQAIEHGRRSMVIEASSEGLAQHRIDGCEIDVAVFTNLTRDHLDFHGTMERYLAAKGILFEKLDEASAKTFPRAAVLNLDDPASEHLRGCSHAPVITYALDRDADFRALDVETTAAGVSFQITAAGAQKVALAPLVGRFNVYNSLAAVAVACSQGVAFDAAVAALSTFPGVPGRMERIDCGQPFQVYVDIASTPAALENVLTALRPSIRGLLWVVFGAAGGRDPARREGMGRVAGRLADRVVLTSEDPRDEDPAAIVDQIARGLIELGRGEGRDFERVIDRYEAIRRALDQAAPDDTVLLAGKATETTMVFENGRSVAWDERTTARDLLRARLTR